MNFAIAWAQTDSVEKGYVNDPNDSGKETNHGVTIAVARAHGYAGAMKDMPLNTAEKIAKEAYWDILSLDEVSAISDNVARKLFDMGFLCGTGTAGRIFQTALNLVRRSSSVRPLYLALVEDGNVGKMTVDAFGLYMKDRANDQGELVLLRMLACQEGQHLIDVCRANPKDDAFVFGWFAKRIAW